MDAGRASDLCGAVTVLEYSGCTKVAEDVAMGGMLCGEHTVVIGAVGAE